MAAANIEDVLISTFSLNSLNDSKSPLIGLLGVMGMYSIKYIVQQIPIIIEFIKNSLKKKVENRMVDVLNNISVDITSNIIFERDYDSRSENHELTDSLIDLCCNLDNVKNLTHKEFFLFSPKEEFLIEKEIYGKLVNLNYNAKGSIMSISFKIYSKTLSLSKLRKWCDSVLYKYKEQKQCGIMTYKYYFNEIPNMPGTCFNQTKFITNKTLDNLFGENIENSKKRLDMFLNNKDWYVEKGIPYSLGFILYGDPGCGKTSFIKAVANVSNRHIFNIQLTKKTTVKELNDLFYNNTINVSEKGTYIKLDIPVSNRLYILEDVDCLTDIVLARKYIENRDTNVDYEKKKAEKVKRENSEELATLSHLLNVLDGVLETDGRMIIMTTNHIDKIDGALKRPGRFDSIIKFEKMSAYALDKMISHFYSNEVKIDTTEFSGCFTPAESQEILLKNLYTTENIYEDFINKKNTKTMEIATSPKIQIIEFLEEKIPDNNSIKEEIRNGEETGDSSNKETDKVCPINMLDKIPDPVTKYEGVGISKNSNSRYKSFSTL
jgi:hypothetical protein